MKQVNSLSLIKRHDNSYFYLIELGFFHGLYKYMLADWKGNALSEPIIIYSHTKRSSLSDIDKEFFDNNLLHRKRLERYVSNENNLYIGGIDRVNGIPVREYREHTIIRKNFKIYRRDNNYILIELISNDEINSYNINEFINQNNTLDFESNKVYTELDLLNIEDELDYIINTLLDKDRIADKVKTSCGYIGTIQKFNGEYRKIFNEVSLEKVKRISAN